MSQTNEDIENIKDRLKKAIVERSYKENHTEMFTLASGKKSPYYFDLKQTLLHPACLKDAAMGLYHLMNKALPAMPRAVGGLTMGADPLVYTLSSLSFEILSNEAGFNEADIIFPFIVRKQVKDHGSKKRIEGLVSQVDHSASVVLIDDVITTGKSTLEAALAIREAGYNPQYAFCVVDRMEGGKENLAQAGISLLSLFDLTDFKNA